jgi:hypothetical protein
MCEEKYKPRLRHSIILVLFIGLMIPGRLGCMEDDSGSLLSQPDIHLPVCDTEWTSTVSCRPLTEGNDFGFADYWDPSRLLLAYSIEAPAEIEKNKPFLLVLHTTGAMGSVANAFQCTVRLDTSSKSVFFHPVRSTGYPRSSLDIPTTKKAYCVVEGLRFTGDWEIRYTPEDEKAVEKWGELPRATITVLEN